MKKIILSLAVILALVSCKGPGSGPLVKQNFAKDGKSTTMDANKSGGMVQVEKANVTVVPCEGCIKISDLFANKKSYAGKSVKIKGQVTKFNPEIMGKNWVHIQDGSEFQGEFDLTVTTDIQTSVGATITFEGKIVLDKDFGYGYVYNVLMEDAKSVL